MQIQIKFASESHVPRFRAGVGTWRSGYMIPIRLPWRHRARPSATLHEIPVCPEGQTCPHNATRRAGVRQQEVVSPILRAADDSRPFVIPTRERSETGGLCFQPSHAILIVGELIGVQKGGSVQ